MTATGASWISDNAFVLNRSAGLELLEQQDSAQLSVADNWFAGNGVGLRGGNIGQVILRDNDFSDQLPRQFGGEFASHLPGYLTSVEADATSGPYLITDLRVAPAADSAVIPETPPALSTGWPALCAEE